MGVNQRDPASTRGFSRSARIYLRPVGFVSQGAEASTPISDGLLPLAGGPVVFSFCEVILREGESTSTTILPVAEITGWSRDADAPVAARVAGLVERLTAARPAFCGLPLDLPLIMGVVNITSDSFSDGGETADAKAAIARGQAFAAGGADIIDVGGESNRPGAEPVPAEVQCERVLPVIRALTAEGLRVSVDTRSSSVMAAALEAGAVMLNDISALTFDPESQALVARSRVPVVLMHMQGTPKTMQLAPHYDHAALEVFDYLEARIEACVAAGIERRRIVVDPGIGFGKTTAHNVEILHNIGLYHGLGCPLLIGISRKSLIAKLSAGEPVKERLPGSLAATLFCLGQGVQILRVHDVAETRQALAVWRALGQ